VKPQELNTSSAATNTPTRGLRSSRKGRPFTAPLTVLLGVAIIALIVRLAPLLRDSVGMNPDSGRYIELAQGFNHGCGFARRLDGSCRAVETLRTPGYPLFLAAMPNLRTAVAIQGLVGAAVCLLVGLYVWRCWGLMAGVAAELLVAFDIPSILFGAMIMSDILFQALVTTGVVLGLWVIARGRNDRMAIAGIVVAAILFGVAISVRPLGVVLPIFAVLPVFLLPRVSWRGTITIALLAGAIPALVIFGWMARNARWTGVWILSTDGPIDLYYYKAAGFVWYRSDKSFRAVEDDLGRDLGWPMRDFTEVPPTLQPEMIQRTFAIVRNDPGASLIMTLRCLAWLAIVPERGNLDAYLGTNAGADSYFAASGNITERIQEMLRSPLLTTLIALQFLAIVFVWIGVARALGTLRHKSARERSLILIPLILTFAFLGLAAGAESIARYRLPVTPMLAVLAAIGWFGRFIVVGGNSESGGIQTAPSPAAVTAD
jgi:hypothetical protein